MSRPGRATHPEWPHTPTRKATRSCFSALVAFPVAWYAVYRWLQGYTYRTSIHIWVFFAAGVAALLIALVTISFQAVRAGMANPIKSLRTE